MGKECVEKLQKIYEDERNARKSPNLQTKKNSIINELEMYSSFITEFFSARCEASNIKEIYSMLEELDSNMECNIKFIDLEVADNFYTEYEVGMLAFIQDVLQAVISNNESELASYTLQLEKVLVNDPNFICSLFGGKNNESIYTSVTKGMTSLEKLVDFIAKIKYFKEKISELSLIAVSDEENETTIQSKCFDLYYNSVSEYCFNVIRSIMETYQCIVNSLLIEKKDDTPIQYKLF